MAKLFYQVQMYSLMRERGQLDEIEELIERFEKRFSWAGVGVTIGLARYAFERGDVSEARKRYDPFARNRFQDVPRRDGYLAILGDLAVLCASLDDSQRAFILYELLAPYRDRNAVHSLYISCGSVSHYLGLLARLLGRRSQAAEHFEQALQMNARMGTQPELARTRYEYAKLLWEDDGEASRQRAGQLIEEARTTAQELGMRALSDEIDRFESD
jgi:tetratricopeptide (TPR) repeat protein